MQIEPTKIKQFKATLADLHEALKEETGQEKIENHMKILQASLRKVPHIVDTLEPEDIGTLVAAVRRKMQEDLLTKTQKKTRSKASRRTFSKDENVNLSFLDDLL